MNDVNNLPSLKPCPFCGHEANLSFSYEPLREASFDITRLGRRIDHPVGHLLGGCWVHCSCGAALGQDGDDYMGETTGAFSSFQDAADAWNKRA